MGDGAEGTEVAECGADLIMWNLPNGLDRHDTAC